MKRLLVFVLLLIPFLYSGQGVIFLKSDPVAYFLKNWICNFIGLKIFSTLNGEDLQKSQELKKEKKKKKNTRRKRTNSRRKKAIKICWN